MENKTKIIIVSIVGVIILLVIGVIIFKMVEKNNNSQPQTAAIQKVEKQITQEDIIKSVTAPVQQEPNDSQPVVDQKVIDSVTAPQTNTTTKQKTPVVDQKVIDSISVPVKK